MFDQHYWPNYGRGDLPPDPSGTLTALRDPAQSQWPQTKPRRRPLGQPQVEGALGHELAGVSALVDLLR
jgi:hypothetical protein